MANQNHPHEWYLDEDGYIDMWRLDEDYHNGPACSLCGEYICEHCLPDWKELECPVASVQPRLFED